MDNARITAKLRSLERTGTAIAVDTFLRDAEAKNLDLRPWDKRIMALRKNKGMMNKWHVLMNKTNATFYSITDGWVTLENATRFTLTEVMQYRKVPRNTFFDKVGPLILTQLEWVEEDRTTDRYARPETPGVDRENRVIGNILKEAIADGGCTFHEADDRVNNASRRLVMSYYKERGAAWLGKVNRGGSDKPDLWQFNGEELFPNHAKVLNFEADFVLPCYDAEIVRMIEERHTPGSYSPEKNAAEVTAIHARIKALGGEHLHWS